MIIEVTNTKHDAAEIERLVHLMASISGVDTGGLLIRVKNARCAYRGRCYFQPPRCSPAAKVPSIRSMITVGIGHKYLFPSNNFVKHLGHPYGGKSSPLIEHRDWREALVAVTTHELRHLYQYQHHLPISEVDAERAASLAVDLYRQDTPSR